MNKKIRKIFTKDELHLIDHLDNLDDIYNFAQKKYLDLNAQKIRANLMKISFVAKRELELYDSIMVKVKPPQYYTEPKLSEYEIARKKAEEKNAALPAHNLEYITNIQIEHGPRWLKTFNTDICPQYKKLYKCKVCEEFFNEKDPYRRCKGQFKLGEKRELPLLKPGTIVEGQWKIISFHSNRIVVEIIDTEIMFASYLNIGETYCLDPITIEKDYEVWEISNAQMKRETSQILLYIWDGVPSLDLDS